MMRPKEQIMRGVRGFTVVELLLGIAITALVALGISAMLAMVSDVTVQSRDDRSVLMRAELAQVRLRAFTEPALAMIGWDPAQGLAIWLLDDTLGSTINLTEVRVIWFDAALGEVIVEHVEFPGTWTQQMINQANVVLPSTSDFFAAMLAQRQAGYTVTETLLETVQTFDCSFSVKRINATRMRIALSLMSDGGTTKDVFIAVGMPNHTVPTS
jgi:hypothetical protein